MRVLSGTQNREFLDWRVERGCFGGDRRANGARMGVKSDNIDRLWGPGMAYYVPRDDDKIMSGYFGLVAICVIHPL